MRCGQLPFRVLQLPQTIVNVGENVVSERYHRRLGAELDALFGKLHGTFQVSDFEVMLREIQVADGEQNGVAKIDFLSMDIEGAEPLALAGFDIERFRPELACIEAKPANREPILKYFADHGYKWIERYFQYDEHNYYFTPKVAHH